MTAAVTPRRMVVALLAPAILAVAVVGLQIVYPIIPAGTARDGLTVATVCVFFAASVTHAVVVRGVRFAGRLLVVTAGGGLLVEALGVATGVPFGAYAYNDSLGPFVLGVPVVIPLAWTMMGYPALLVARRITSRPLLGPVTAGAALATWDLFLDPQMVAASHWTWQPTGGPELLGIPLANFVGWFVVSTAMMAMLWQRTTLGQPWADATPLALYLWTYTSSVLAHAVYLGLPGSAIVGGLGMGVVVVTFLRAVWIRG